MVDIAVDIEHGCNSNTELIRYTPVIGVVGLYNHMYSDSTIKHYNISGDFVPTNNTQTDIICGDYGEYFVSDIHQHGSHSSLNIEYDTAFGYELFNGIASTATITHYNAIGDFTEQSVIPETGIICASFGSLIESRDFEFGNASTVTIEYDLSFGYSATHGISSSTQLTNHNYEVNFESTTPVIIDDPICGNFSTAQDIVLVVDSFETGSNALLTTLNTNLIRLESQQYNGAESVNELFHRVHLYPVTPNGSYLDTTFLTFPSAEFEIDFQSSYYVNLDFTTFGILGNCIATHGHNTPFEILTRPAFKPEIDFYGGNTGAIDLTAYIRLSCANSHGSISVIDELISPPSINLGVVTCNNGHSVNLLNVLADKIISITYPNGAGSVIDLTTFEADNLATIIYNGSSSELVALSLPLTFSGIATHGVNSNLDLKRPATFIAHIINGLQVAPCNFSIFPAAELDCPIYNGGYTTTSYEVPFLTIFPVSEIAAGIACFVGTSGVGGVNFCLTSTNHIELIDDTRYESLSNIDVDFRYGEVDDITSVCHKGGIKFDTTFSITPVLEFDFYDGTSVTTAIPQLLQSLYRSTAGKYELYDIVSPVPPPNPNFIGGANFGHGSQSFTYDMYDDVITYHGSCSDTELTPTRLHEMYSGEVLTASLFTIRATWRLAEKPIKIGSQSTIDFYPNHKVRMCRGYILPNGNNANVDFGIIDDLQCNDVNGYHGEYCELLHLYTDPVIELDAVHNGIETTFGFNFYEPFSYSFLFGHTSEIQSGAELFPNNLYGSSYISFFDFKQDLYIGYYGAHVVMGLTVPGQGVEFVTEELVHLPNQYIDPVELPYTIEVPVEAYPYKTQIDARCVSAIIEGL